MLTLNTQAPEFSLQDNNENIVNLRDFRNKKNVVLYFYPEDDTPGCTLEAQSFSDNKTRYDALETVVLGVSDNSVKSHQKFCNKYGLVITLLADPDHKTIEQYGAWQLKKMMGREFMGTVRSTYLIDKAGIIRAVWPSVTVNGHEQEVLEAVEKLTSQLKD
jgi:peroxiredoxin Q/BCP